MIGTASQLKLASTSYTTPAFRLKQLSLASILINLATASNTRATYVAS